jgi:hypothetical protein
VDRLVGLYAGTAKRRLEGYTRGEKFYDPVPREEPTGSVGTTATLRASLALIYRCDPAVEKRLKVGGYHGVLMDHRRSRLGYVCFHR